jgi:NDP-sugar pyrophosphorylase family protein
MAGGFGSRYGKLKQFDGFGPNGEFLMEYSMYDAIQNGFTHIVVVTHKDSVEKIQSYLRERLPAHVALDVVPQVIEDVPTGSTYDPDRSKPWGTAHAVWAAREVIKGPFGVLNADDYYGQQAFAESAGFFNDASHNNNYALVAYRLDETLSTHGSVSRGVSETDGHMLKKVTERLKLVPFEGQVKDEEDGTLFKGDEPVSMNFWLCRANIFDFIEKRFTEFLASSESEGKGEIYLPKIVQEMLDAEMIGVAVVPSKSQWFGVTYSDDKEFAQKELAGNVDKGLYPSPLWG